MLRIAHLPPGRPPGRQSRRDRVLFPLWIAVAALLFGGFFGYLAYGNVTDGRLGAGDLWVLAAVAVVAGCWWEVRQRFPRRARHLSLTVAAAEVRRGGSVSATLTISGSAPSRAERLEVGLVCVERYDEFADSRQTRFTTWPKTEQQTVYERWRKVDRASPYQQLQFKIPARLPYSYEGAHVSFAWRVAVREVRSGREDRFASHPIWVMP